MENGESTTEGGEQRAELEVRFDELFKDGVDYLGFFVVRDVTAVFYGMELRVRDGFAEQFTICKRDGGIVPPPEQESRLVQFSHTLVSF